LQNYSKSQISGIYFNKSSTSLIENHQITFLLGANCDIS